MTDSSGAKAKKIVLGQIGKVHGIKGWLRLNSFTSPPANILKYSRLMVQFGEQSELLKIDEFKYIFRDFEFFLDVKMFFQKG